MTDEIFEQRLRRWYREEVAPDMLAPLELHAAVAEIPAQPRPALLPAVRRNFSLLAAAVLLVVGSALGALVAGSVVTHLRSVATPVPSVPASAIVQPTPTPTPTPSPVLTPSPAPTASPIVIPGSLVAVYHGLGATAEILTLDPETGDQVVLGTVDIDSVQLRSGVYASVAWSTDRRLVSVSRSGDGFLPQAQFDVVDLSVTPITNRIGESYVSPDGQKVAGIDVFGEQADAPIGIFVVDLGGSALQQIELPAGGQYITHFAWAPDGSAFVVSGYLPGEPIADTSSSDGQVFADTQAGPGWVFIVPLNGDPILQFGGIADSTFSLVQLSPDKSMVVATLDCPPPCASGLVQIDVATGVLTHLTNGASDVNAQWSPDGERIAFARAGGAGRGIWVMNADGSSLTRLTAPQRPDRDHDLAWSPDGSSLIFSRSDTSKTGLGDLYAVPVTGGEPRLLYANAVGDW